MKMADQIRNEPVSELGFPKTNNFDLLRLFAASQVVLFHALEHLKIELSPALMSVISAVPGVPIFFMVSGFLITASYQRQSSLTRFAINRALRIMPALWGCLLISVISALAIGNIIFETSSFAIWIAAQATIGQFYNPDFMRGYGVGVLNGSLWTIPVEMQFYILTPVLIALYIKARRIFWITFAVFISLNVANSFGLIAENLPGIIGKLFSVSFLPWISMFIFGALLQIYYTKIRVFIEGKALYWIAAYGLAIAVNHWVDLGIYGNRIALPWSVLLSVTACSCAFTLPGLSDRILRGNDISYGLYIYHMPVLNAVLETGPYSYPLAIVIGCTVVLAIISWKVIEKPALRMKPKSIR